MAVNLEAIKSKVGPLPVWVWGVLAGTVGLGVYYVRSVQSGNKNTDGVGQQEFWAVEDTTVQDNIQARQLADTSFETNDSWLAKAVAFLATQGWSPSDALTTLQNFLAGVPVVGADGKKQVDAVLDRFGTPPNGTYGTPSFVDAPTATKSPKGYWHVVGSNPRKRYAAYTDGSKHLLSDTEWTALGKPGTTSTSQRYLDKHFPTNV